MTDGSAIADQLNFNRISGYSVEIADSPIDALIERAIDSYTSLAPAQRAAFLRAFTADHTWTLLIYAVRMAHRAINRRSSEAVRRGLMAIVIEHLQLDAREDLMILSLLNHSAEAIGADSVALFEQAAQQADPQTAALLREFAARPAGLKQIEQFGFRAIGDIGSVRYQRG